MIESILCELAQNQIIEALRRQVETSNNADRDAQVQLNNSRNRTYGLLCHWQQSLRPPSINGESFMVRYIKHQTMDNAFGMTMDLFGPYSLRKNDLKLLTFSNINGRVAM